MLSDGIFERGEKLVYVVDDFLYVPIGRVFTFYDLELSLAFISFVYREAAIRVYLETNCPYYVRNVVLWYVLCGEDVFRNSRLYMLCFVIL